MVLLAVMDADVATGPPPRAMKGAPELNLHVLFNFDECRVRRVEIVDLRRAGLFRGATGEDADTATKSPKNNRSAAINGANLG